MDYFLVLNMRRVLLIKLPRVVYKSKIQFLFKVNLSFGKSYIIVSINYIDFGSGKALKSWDEY